MSKQLVSTTTPIWSNPNNLFFNVSTSAFINFFRFNLLTIPLRLKSSYSFQRTAYRVPLIKMINLLTNQGLFHKINYTLIAALNTINLTSVGVINNLTHLPHYLLSIQNNLTNVFSLGIKSDLGVNDSWLFLLYLINQVNPIFLFSLSKIDKKIRKFSRGKSGKYKLVFKYIAPYKRSYIVMKSLVKELRFLSKRTLLQRLIALFQTFIFNRAESLPWRTKVFSHKYAFQSAKHKLIRLSRNV